jgi:hypothetical protein
MELLIPRLPVRTSDAAAQDDSTSDQNPLAQLWDEAERDVAAEQAREESEHARWAATPPLARPKPASSSVRFAYD